MKFVLSSLIFALFLFPSSGVDQENTPEYKLIIFEGSDWCRNCRRFEKEVLSKPDFVSFLKEKAIEVEKIDFPQRKKLDKEVREYNNAIAEKYAFEGVFPTIILARVGSSEFSQLTDYVNQSVEEIKEQLEAKMESMQ